MAKRVQLRRGTTAQQQAFTGALAELTVDTTTGHLRIGNGSTPGGALVSPELNVQWFGARGDGTTDNTTALQAVIDECPDGGCIRIPPGVFAYDGVLEFDERFDVKILGSGGQAHSPVSRLLHTGDGSHGILIDNSQSVRFKDVGIQYDNASFAGNLIHVAGSVADSAYIDIEHCRLSGTASAKGAAALVRFQNSIICSVRHSACWYAQRAISRVSSGGYVNVLEIHDVSFNHLVLPPILNPGEMWSIRGCTFEPLDDGSAGAVEHTDLGVYAQGLIYAGNWHGDATTGGAPWVILQALGLALHGNVFGPTGGTTADDYAIGLLASEGVNIMGNRFNTYHGIKFLDDVPGINIMGNDWGGAGTGLIDIDTHAPFAVVLGNDGFSNRIAASAANADTSGATLGQLETEVNELKAALRQAGVILT